VRGKVAKLLSRYATATIKERGGKHTIAHKKFAKNAKGADVVVTKNQVIDEQMIHSSNIKKVWNNTPRPKRAAMKKMILDVLNKGKVNVQNGLHSSVVHA
jgi:hypothetical protein